MNESVSTTTSKGHITIPIPPARSREVSMRVDRCRACCYTRLCLPRV